MSAGFFIRNNNKIIVDGTYVNQALRTQSSLAITQWNTLGYYMQTFTMPCSPSGQLAFKADNYMLVLSQAQISQTTRQYTIVSLVSQNFTVFVFDEPEFITGSGVGVQVRNRATNKIIFDSRMKYLRVMAYLPGITQPETSYSGIANPAMIPTQSHYEHQEEIFGAGQVYVLINDAGVFFNTAGAVCRTKQMSYYSSTVQVDDSYEVTQFTSGTASYLLIDVLNF